MKKLLIRILIGLVVLVILVVVAIGLFLDSAIKKGVETLGPQITKVEIKLDGANLSLRAGSVNIKGLVVGNPEGYKTPHAISVGLAKVVVRIGSVLSDKIIIKSIRVEAPEITYEGNLLGTDNLHKILENVNAAAGTGSGSDSASSSGGKPAKKLQVDDFLITGAKVNLSIKGTGGLAAPVTIPDIHLSNLGQGPEGITAAELTKQVLQIVTADVVKYAVSQATDLGKGAVNEATKDIGKTTKGITDLFKKKK